jgi:hypothetical protein
VNHGYLELVCREIVCGIRDIKDLPKPVRRGSRKEGAHMPWFTEPPKKALANINTPIGIKFCKPSPVQYDTINIEISASAMASKKLNYKKPSLVMVKQPIVAGP